MNPNNATIWLLCLLGLAPIVGQVHASTLVATGGPASATVLYSGNELTGSGANTVSLSIPSAGDLFLTLTDLDFPNPFAFLKFSLTDTHNALAGGLTNPGMLQLSLTGPTTLYADVLARAASGGPGLYNLTATFVSSAPVGLPGSGELLGAVTALAVGLDLIWRRSRARATVTTAVA
jgi:hypothetical protein